MRMLELFGKLQQMLGGQGLIGILTKIASGREPIDAPLIIMLVLAIVAFLAGKKQEKMRRENYEESQKAVEEYVEKDLTGELKEQGLYCLYKMEKRRSLTFSLSPKKLLGIGSTVSSPAIFIDSKPFDKEDKEEEETEKVETEKVEYINEIPSRWRNRQFCLLFFSICFQPFTWLWCCFVCYPWKYRKCCPKKCHKFWGIAEDDVLCDEDLEAIAKTAPAERRMRCCGGCFYFFLCLIPFLCCPWKFRSCCPKYSHGFWGIEENDVLCEKDKEYIKNKGRYIKEKKAKAVEAKAVEMIRV
jgi:hypothetical protein